MLSMILQCMNVAKWFYAVCMIVVCPRSAAVTRQTRPAMLLNALAIGIYRTHPDLVFSETSRITSDPPWDDGADSPRVSEIHRPTDRVFVSVPRLQAG